MNFSKKHKIKVIIVAVTICVLYAAGLYFFATQKDTDHYVGSTVVIKGDTCLVLAFDFETYNYVLDDGRHISERMVELFEIK